MVFWFITFFVKVVKITFSAYQKNLNFKKREVWKATPVQKQILVLPLHSEVLFVTLRI